MQQTNHDKRDTLKDPEKSIHAEHEKISLFDDREFLFLPSLTTTQSNRTSP